MEKPIYASAEDAKAAIIKMEKARLVLNNGGLLSKKYNKLLIKRIGKLMKTYKISIGELLAVVHGKP